jgi:hypothetical protein
MVPATKEETGGTQSKASPGKVSGRPYLKNKLKAKGLSAWGKLKALSSIPRATKNTAIPKCLYT